MTLDLRSGEIRTILWATGFRPDLSWLDVPVFDRKGRIRHDGGVTASPGLYLIGMPFLRRRKSSFIDGAAADAADLSDHLARYLDIQLRSIPWTTTTTRSSSADACAGAATAMLLARGGLRVLVIEAARRGTDTLSTHALMRGGVLQLHRWGLLDAVVAAGTPAIRATEFSYGDDDRDGRHPPRRRNIRAARPTPNRPRRAAARCGPRGRRRDPQPGPGDPPADRRRHGARRRGGHARDRHVASAPPRR